MAMGQAAGYAAALAVRAGVSAAELDGRRVREALTRAGAGPFEPAAHQAGAAAG